MLGALKFLQMYMLVDYIRMKNHMWDRTEEVRNELLFFYFLIP